MRTLIIIACALAAVMLAAEVRPDEQLKWESHGPYGGIAFEISVDPANPKRVFAHMGNGYFFSKDAGGTWKRIPPLKDAWYLQQMFLIGGRAYCAKQNVAYVTDNGEKWQKFAELDSGARILSITSEPGKPERKWCLYVIESSEVGARPDPSPMDMLCISRLGGGKDKAAAIGYFPRSKLDRRWYRMFVSPADSKVIRVFSGFVEPGMEVSGTDDGGKTWEQWSIDLHPHELAFSGTEPKTIYAAAWRIPGRKGGLIKSTDGGKTWKELSSDKRISSLQTLMFHPKTGELFLGGVKTGLFKTSDFGKTLTDLNKGLDNRSIGTIAADPADEKTLYAGSDFGVYKSTDGGKSWKRSSDGLHACLLMGLAAFNDSTGTMVVAEEYQGLRISTDCGQTWSPAKKHAFIDGRTLHICSGGKTLLLLVGPASKEGYATHVSRDMGKTWQHVEALGEKDFPIAVISDSEMYAVRDRLTLLKSTDGVTWKKFAGPFKELGYEIKLVAAPPTGGHLLVAGQAGIVKCGRTGGKRLGFIKAPEDSSIRLPSYAFDPSDADVLYVGIYEGIAACNLKTGKWTVAYKHKELMGIAFDPGSKDRAVAAFWDGHMAVSGDGGKTWKPLKPEVPFYNIREMAITARRKLIVAGNGAIHTLDLSKLD